MQTDNPLWETTADDTIIPIRVVSKKQEHVVDVKRSPAALFGITIMVFAGFIMFGGMNLFSAQVTGNEIKATITDTGIQPVEIVAKAGQRIHWLNTGSIPHILESTTLKDEKGKNMETTAIFPGSEVTYDIPLSALDGSYDYESRTSKKISGRIIIQNSMTTPTTPVAPSVPVAPMPVAPVTTSSSLPITSSSSSNITTTVIPDNGVMNTTITKNVENIPVNPNTVSKGTISPITKNIQATAITTHRPTKQPESGTSAWILAFCGVAALYGVMKKASI